MNSTEEDIASPDKKNNYSTKILGIMAFIFIILALTVIARTPSASGYELSIYEAFPLYFWIFLIGAIFTGIVIILQEIFKNKKTNLWIFGFIAVLIGNTIFLLLPVFRGYCIIGGPNADIFSHIGWIREIAQSGHVGINNFYPIIHIIILSISNMIGVNVSSMINYIPAFFWALYTPFMFLMARSISNNKGHTLLITAFSFTLLFSFFYFTIHPSFLSFIFLPFLLYLYHKRNHSLRKIELSILIIILCYFIVFFHPITTLIAILIFGTFVVLSIIIKLVKKPKDNINISIRQSNATTLILILAISFFTWYTSQGSGRFAINAIYSSLVQGSDVTIASNYINTLSIANLTLLQTIRLFTLKYGAIIIYSLIGFFFIFITIKKINFSKRIKELEFLYGIQCITGFLTAGVMIAANFIVKNPIRSARYFLMMITVFNGLVLYSLSEKNKKISESLVDFKKKNPYFQKSLKRKAVKRKILYLTISIVLLSSCMLCILNVYSSPISWQSNKQFTYMNFAGSAWTTENRDLMIQTSSDSGYNLERMEHYINGVIIGKKHIKKEPFSTPTHFGYNYNNSLSQVFNYTYTYMITTENGKQAVNAFPNNIKPMATQYTSEDFKKLNSDINVSKLYDNRELEIWFVYGK